MTSITTRQILPILIPSDLSVVKRQSLRDPSASKPLRFGMIFLWISKLLQSQTLKRITKITSSHDIDQNFNLSLWLSNNLYTDPFDPWRYIYILFTTNWLSPIPNDSSVIVVVSPSRRCSALGPFSLGWGEGASFSLDMSLSLGPRSPTWYPFTVFHVSGFWWASPTTSANSNVYNYIAFTQPYFIKRKYLIMLLQTSLFTFVFASICVFLH